MDTLLFIWNNNNDFWWFQAALRLKEMSEIHYKQDKDESASIDSQMSVTSEIFDQT